jgi:hypothetical protein
MNTLIVNPQLKSKLSTAFVEAFKGNSSIEGWITGKLELSPTVRRTLHIQQNWDDYELFNAELDLRSQLMEIVDDYYTSLGLPQAEGYSCITEWASLKTHTGEVPEREIEQALLGAWTGDLTLCHELVLSYLSVSEVH